MYLHTLAQYVKYFPGRPATYIDAEAPPTTSAKEAWTVLESALGLTGPVELGDPVQFTPDGLPPIEGVVDYVEPGGDLLAVRTRDGLYRFHNRAIMEMPIAVGHYLYTPTDRESTQNAWKSWLDRVFT